MAAVATMVPMFTAFMMILMLGMVILRMGMIHYNFRDNSALFCVVLPFL